MWLSSLSIRKPVVAAVSALLLVALGIGAAQRLPVREYPDVDPPIVSVSVTYPGASAEVVERDVTRVIEDNLSGIDDVEQIESTSRADFAQIDIEFALSRDLDAAAADVRDRVSAVRNELPEEVEDPVISKASADAQAMMWITLNSEKLDTKALTDFAIRNLVDPLSIVPGVAQVIIGGERRYAMRIWLDAQRLAAFNLTTTDVVNALRQENIEAPAGRVETGPTELTVRTTTKFRTPEEFRSLVLREAGDYQVTLSDVAQVARGAESYRGTVLRSGEEGVGLGVVRQSGSNTLAVAQQVRAELDRLRRTLPEGVSLEIVYDQSIFIEGSTQEVINTLIITAVLVVVVIYLFLGSLRATLAPAVTIPVSLLATFTVMYAAGFSINTLTLLALVLAIGLVVDDAIVVLENVTRHREEGEPPLVAGVRGSAEVALAVIATTAVLVAVLLPISAIQGTLGRLFTEFSITLVAALVFSTFQSLTIAAMIASKVAEPAPPPEERAWLPRLFTRFIDWVERQYQAAARFVIQAGWVAAIAATVLGAGAYFLFTNLPNELAPTEDRGTFIIPVSAPEGASIEQTRAVVEEIDNIIAPYREQGGPVEDTISIVGIGRGGPPEVTQALVIVKMKPWDERDISQMQLVEKLTPQILALPGARAIPINPPSLVSEGFGKPIQFVISGPDYETAEKWARTVLAQARELGTMNQLELEFNRRTPQVQIAVDRRKAADLGVSVSDIGETLRVFMGGDEITEYYERGETYEVVVRGREEDRDAPEDIAEIKVRNAEGQLIPLASVVQITEQGTAAEYRRVDRQPSMVISAVPAPGNDIGSILDSLERIVQEQLPPEARVNYLGVSKEFQRASSGTLAIFGLALVVVYLTLAALFESFVYPVIILFAVPLALAGGLGVLALLGMSINTFSQIALLLVVGLLAKNAILIVDFANQRRRQGQEIREAMLEAAKTRFRPILMTSISTAFGAVPLALATGPGAEPRQVIGAVIIAGVIVATAITLLIVPGLYDIAARFAAIPGQVDRELEKQREDMEAGNTGSQTAPVRTQPAE